MTLWYGVQDAILAEHLEELDKLAQELESENGGLGDARASRLRQHIQDLREVLPWPSGRVM